MYRRMRATLAVVLLLLLPRCGGEGEAVPALAESYDSPEALARDVLDAIAADDGEALRRVMVNEAEYRELFWSELPERDDVPFEMAWQMNEAGSRKARNSVLSDFGGTRFELVSIELPGPTEEYPSFTVHFGARLTVRRLSDGKVGAVGILDVLAERDGRWKALNFGER